MTSTTTVADLLAEYRRLSDRDDELAAEKSAIYKRFCELEHEIAAAMDAAGMTDDGAKVSASGMSVTRRTKFRAKYDPALWASLVRWSVETNRTDLIQRRLADAKILELHDAGEVLPEGLTLEAYKSIDARRVG